MEQRERADEVFPSRRVGGVCDEQVEEDSGWAWRRGWGQGAFEAQPTSGSEGERGLG